MIRKSISIEEINDGLTAYPTPRYLAKIKIDAGDSALVYEHSFKKIGNAANLTKLLADVFSVGYALIVITKFMKECDE